MKSIARSGLVARDKELDCSRRAMACGDRWEARGSRWSRESRGSGRVASWLSSRRSPHPRARPWQQPVVSASPAGWRSPRWPTGCGTPNSSQPSRDWIPCGERRWLAWYRTFFGRTPAQRQEPTESRDVGSTVDAWQRHRFFEGLARAVLSPGRPILLVLDDVHWCDQETMDWLVFLLGFAKDERLLVASSTRIDELEHNREVVTSLRGLRSAGLVTDVELAPLDVAGTGELAAALLGRELRRRRRGDSCKPRRAAIRCSCSKRHAR